MTKAQITKDDVTLFAESLFRMAEEAGFHGYQVPAILRAAADIIEDNLNDNSERGPSTLQ